MSDSMNRPAYIDLDDREREAFLSERGNFSPDERAIFRELVSVWEPRIDYDRFLKRVRETGGPSQVASLMNKLWNARIGLLRTQMVEGERKPVALLLLEEESFNFYFEAIQETYVELTESIGNPLPFRSRLQERGLSVPDAFLRVLDNEALVRVFQEKEQKEPFIASLVSLNSYQLILPSSHLRAFVNIGMLKIRYYMSNTSLLESVARFQDTSLMAVKQGLKGKEPQFWLTLVSTIVDKRKELQASRNVSAGKDFYHAAYLLRRLVTAQLEEAKERKRERKEREIDLETAAMSVKEADTPLLDQNEMNAIIDRFKEKYGSDLEGFREEFYERYVHAKGKRSLPKVVMVDSSYIHRDNFYPVFLERFQVLSSELRHHYKDQMVEELRREGNGSTMFYSHENFENDIRDQIAGRDSFVASVLSKPAILAEAVILYAKQRKQVKSMDDLKEQLSLYFNPESMKLLDLPTIFNLSLGEIYDEAFEELHILRRIWIRLTGKYNTVRDKYVSRSVLRSTARRSRPSPPKGIASQKGREVVELRDPPRRERGETSRGGGGRRRPETYKPQRRSRVQQVETQKVKKPYSKKQRDTAWEAFGATIKKKGE
ncbi:MAG: hypothetical protein ACOC47_10580 [Alkalispirochaetaceae bacterium]